MKRTLGNFVVIVCLVILPEYAWASFVLETSQSPSHLVVKNNDLFWSDATDSPVKKISLLDGTVTLLVRKMGPPLGLAIYDGQIFWIEGGHINKTSLADMETIILAQRENPREATNDLLCDGHFLYWVNSTVSPDTYIIKKVPLTGGASLTVATSGMFKPIVALRMDETHLYWQEGFWPDQCAIKKIPLAGGDVTTVYETTSYPMTRGFAVHGGFLYFSEQGFSALPAQRLLKVSADGSQTSQVADIVANRPVVQGDRLYFFHGTNLKAMPINGGAITTLAENITPSTDMLIIGSEIFWGESPGTGEGETGKVKSVSIYGGSVTALSTTGDTPNRLATDGQNLLWIESYSAGLPSSSGRIVKASLKGGKMTTLIEGITSVSSLAADDTHVYVADGWRVKRMPLYGGAIETVVRGSDEIGDIALDGEDVYWIEKYSSVVRKAPKQGDTITTLSPTLTGMAGPIKILNGNVYWMTNFDAIKKAPVTGGTVLPIASGLPFLSDFAVDETGIYLAEHDTGAIKMVPLAGGESAPIITRTASSAPRRLAVDTQFLYWVDQSEVGRIPKGGGSPEIIAVNLNSDPFSANSVAVDNKGVFWTETGSGEIRTTMAMTGESSAYFPLESGITWNYLENGALAVNRTVLAGSVDVNGVSTRVIQYSADGTLQYFTNDASGIREHREYYPGLMVEGVGNIEATVTFSPPMVYALPVMTMGQAMVGSGTATLELGQLGASLLTYDSTSTPEGFETLHLPSGIFKTARLKSSIRFYGPVNNQWLDMTLPQTIWLTQGLGLVKYSESEDGFTTTGVLTDTTIPYADLSMAASQDLDTIIKGEKETLRTVVGNNGPDAATNVKVTCNLPADTDLFSLSPGCSVEGSSVVCTIPSIASGANAMFTFTVIPGSQGIKSSIFSVTGNEVDPNGDNNSISLVTTVLLDSDGDGITDDLEDANHNGLVDPGETDPFKADTDGDEMPDGWEVTHQLNPLVADGTGDMDSDGFTNLEEYLARTDPGNINNRPYADVNGDRRMTLEDLILSLKTLTSMEASGIRADYANSGTDVNGDQKIGIAEMLYLLQHLSGWR